MMRRVVIIGASGAGKTTFAKALSTHLKIPHIELDSLYWGPNWTPRDEFAGQIEQGVSGDEWIVDGNYSKVQHLIWQRADTIIWLNFSLHILLGRLMRRTACRCVTQEKLWAGNRERIGVQLFTRDSIFRWSVSQYFRYRREYPALLMEAARRGTHIVRFRSPKQTRAWLDDLRELIDESA